MLEDSILETFSQRKRMKTIIIGLLAIFLAVIAQVAFIGINGLTLFSIPTTIYLGFEVIEKLTENKSNC